MRDLKKYLKDFDNLEFENIQASYRKKKFFEVLSNFNDVNHVLEIGCGENSIFEHQVWHSNTLIEPIQEFISRLNHRIDTTAININHCYLEDFKSPKKYDLIVLSCLLHEISDKAYFIGCLKNLMHGKSIIYIDVPNALSVHRHLAVYSGYLNDVYSKTETSEQMQQDDTVFSPDSLSTFLKDCGFEVKDIGTNFVKFFHHSKMAALVEEGHLGKNELDAFYDLEKTFPENGSEIWCVAGKING